MVAEERGKRKEESGDQPPHAKVHPLGGGDYARSFGRELLGGLPNAYLDRYPRLAVAGELYLDDDPFETYRSSTIHPAWLAPAEAVH